MRRKDSAGVSLALFFSYSKEKRSWMNMTDKEKRTIDSLIAKKVPITKIAEQVGMSKNTVKAIPHNCKTEKNVV